MSALNHMVCRSILVASIAPWIARAAETSSAPVHLSPVGLDSGGGTTPWVFSPIWFVLFSVLLPAILWTALAWKRAFEEDPHRLRRAGSRELRRLLSRLQRAGGTPREIDLHAWLQAAARTWGVRVSTPTEADLNRSLRALDSDATTQVRWRELWKSAERCLYAADATLSPDWVRETSVVAKQVHIPPRKHWFPRRVRHWLPSVAAGLCACTLLVSPYQGLLAHEEDELPAPRVSTRKSPKSEEAKPPPIQELLPELAQDAEGAAALREAQGRANNALRADWNNWAAHYNIAAQQMVQGNMDYAVAHLTAALLQHPTSSDVQDNLRWSLQQAGTMDPTLRRLLYGAWFQRYPALLTPASWQKLGLFASLVTAGGLSALVLAIFTNRRRRELRLGGGWGATAGAALLALSALSWNGWGHLRHPNVAMLVEGINLGPAPTDLVKDRETLPVRAGSITLIQASFLGWKQVDLPLVPDGKVTGWVRAPYVMPLYATE